MNGIETNAETMYGLWRNASDFHQIQWMVDRVGVSLRDCLVAIFRNRKHYSYLGCYDGTPSHGDNMFEMGGPDFPYGYAFSFSVSAPPEAKAPIILVNKQANMVSAQAYNDMVVSVAKLSDDLFSGTVERFSFNAYDQTVNIQWRNHTGTPEIQLQMVWAKKAYATWCTIIRDSLSYEHQSGTYKTLIEEVLTYFGPSQLGIKHLNENGVSEGLLYHYRNVGSPADNLLRTLYDTIGVLVSHGMTDLTPLHAWGIMVFDWRDGEGHQYHDDGKSTIPPKASNNLDARMTSITNALAQGVYKYIYSDTVDESDPTTKSVFFEYCPPVFSKLLRTARYTINRGNYIYGKHN